ncbi:MAG: serine/threonine protein kinase [Cyanothece sp. SIO2G6]|nr:serine/threonine protein kinase [Cyanothece sp. SIO2G6]
MAISSSEAWIGTVLRDRYELQRQLGRTAGRRTFLAQDTQTEQTVVVKLVTFGDDFEWADLRLFEREGEVLKALDHPSIPRYLDYFEVDLPYARGYALVQSYVEGRSLQDAVQAGRTFAEADLVAIAQQLLDILSYLHSQTPPVIHRDIKPSNILITDRSAHSVGTLYLVDFGSVQAPALGQLGTLTIVGTFGYMPPEQFGGRADPPSDLYSLAATLIYLATGKHPAELPQRDFKIQYESEAQHLSFALRRWLSWLITPEITKRPQTAIAAKQSLEKAAMGQTDLILKDKPVGSKVMLSKYDEIFELVVPPWGFRVRKLRSWRQLALMTLALSVVSGIVSGGLNIAFLTFYRQLGYVALMMGLWIWLMVGLIGFVAGTWVVLNPLWRVTQDFFWQTHLRVDQQNLRVVRELTLGFGGQKQIFSVPCDRIQSIRLELSPKKCLVIQTLDTQFSLDNKLFPFSTQELRWIGQDLADWLGVAFITSAQHRTG